MITRILILLILLGAAACAEVGRPPGGPVDETPPTVLASQPESVAVGVASDTPLQFVFSEKVDRRGFERALTFVPEVEMRSPRFDGESVNLAPVHAWPADTVVVWTLSAGLKDRHGVALGKAISGVFTTADALPTGQIVGTATLDTLVSKEPDWSRLRAELTLPAREGERRNRPWRSVEGSIEGRFELSWLDLPSGPFDLQVFLDGNANGKRDDREPVASVDSLFLLPADSILRIDAHVLRLIDLEGPVPVFLCLGGGELDSLRIEVWATHEEAERVSRANFDSLGCETVEWTPGLTTYGGWLDLDGDGHFGVDSTGISEPYFGPDTLLVLPAQPDTHRIDWPSLRQSKDALDSLRTPPVPEELWSTQG